MKLKMVVVDFELSPRARQWFFRIGIALLVLGCGAIAYADFPNPQYKPNDKLTAESLNKNFNDLDARVSMAAPPGTIIAYGGQIDKNPGEDPDNGDPQHPPPDGWLLCDGEEVSRTDYASLYAALKIGFGGGDGDKTYNLPDLRGMFLRGVNGSRTTVAALGLTVAPDPDSSSRSLSSHLGESGGDVGSVQRDAYAKHFHPITDQLHNHTGTLGSLLEQASAVGGNCSGGYGAGLAFGPAICGSGLSDSYTHIAKTEDAPATGGNETRPINVYVNYIIKY